MTIRVKHVGWGTWRWITPVGSGCAFTRWGALREARRAVRYARESIIEEQA